MPYWAELWPAGLALASALPAGLDGMRIVELGAGLGVPALVAAARGAEVTAVDWAADAAELLTRNAIRNGLEVGVVCADWRVFAGSFDLVLAADVLYEERNVGALLDLLPRLAPEVLLARAGRAHEAEFEAAASGSWHFESLAPRVHRLTRATRGSLPARPDG